MTRTVNGVPVIGVQRVPWQVDDDARVVMSTESRGLVLFDRGGKSDAVVVDGNAIIWERDGARFRAFPLDIPGATGRDPARSQIAPGLWSVAVPGVIRNTMLRVALAVEESARVALAVASIELHTARGTVERIEIAPKELRAVLGVVGEWPGVRRG